MATGSKTATAKSAPSPLPLFPEEGGAIQGDLFANFTGNEAGRSQKIESRDVRNSLIATTNSLIQRRKELKSFKSYLHRKFSR